jgi:hypothetical protein
MSLNQQVIAEFSPCTPRTSQLRDYPSKRFGHVAPSLNERGGDMRGRQSERRRYAPDAVAHELEQFFYL